MVVAGPDGDHAAHAALICLSADRTRRLHEVAPNFIDADNSPSAGGYPVGGLTVIAFRNGHLSYALTWFALAGMSAWGLSFVLRER